MNIATGSLLFLGFVLLILGVASKFLGMSLLAPTFTASFGYFIAANSCLLLALVIDKFEKS
ncbi:MAG: hypothetical protein ISS92_06190 [Candidatus Omnitrophica bacterium]|nr:hypothetical protein [Candidatus Omnitrophota bacterium]